MAEIEIDDNDLIVISDKNLKGIPKPAKGEPGDKIGVGKGKPTDNKLKIYIDVSNGDIWINE